MGRKILIVDDDPDILFVLERFLKRAGYEVLKAKGGAECLEKLSSDKPNAVILDIMMPDMGGWDVCRIIKQKYNIPVTMCSILGEPEHVKWSIEFSGADEHITKPLSFDKVMQGIRGFGLHASPTKEKITLGVN